MHLSKMQCYAKGWCELATNEAAQGAEAQSAQGTGGKLKPKDLITVGVFTAIYFVITSAIGMLGVIPVCVPMAAILVPLIGGIPLMLFITKARKFGMLLILSTLEGILMFLTGMGYFSIATGFIFGLAAELILKSGNWASSKKSVIAYAVQSMWVVGNFIPMFAIRDAYFAPYLSKFGEEYVSILMSLTPPWTLPLFFVVSFVSGAIGGLIGRKLYRKHFKRAGIA